MTQNFSFISSLNIIAIIYFIFFIVSIPMGVYVLQKNKDSRAAKVFFLLSIVFSCLDIGEIFFTWSTFKEDAFAFTAVKSIGFVLWCPLTLHMFLSIKYEKLKKGWIIFLSASYIYSVICIVGFFLGINRAADFVRIGLTWVDIPYWSPLGLPYLVMMPTCVVLSFYTLMTIRKKAVIEKNELTRKQMNVMIGSGLPLFFLAICFNLILPNLKIPVPSIGNMFIGFWMILLGYSIMKYKFLVPTLEFASKQIFLIAGEIMVISDLHFGITEYNESFSKQLGYPDGSALHLSDIIIDYQFTSLSTENDFNRIAQLKRYDGSLMYVNMKGANLYEKNIPIGIVFLFSDISELKNQNEILELKIKERTKLLAEAKEEAERRLKITQIYTRKSIVDIIQKGDDPTSFIPISQNYTILFSDIRDFTYHSENLSPLATVALLNNYFECMNECVTKNNGEIDKLIGDCIMALFQNPEDAIICAIEMRKKLTTINLNENLKIPLNNGIGINYGEVTVGNIGSPSKMDWTVIGDIVNSASRLESLTKVYKVPIIISEEIKNVIGTSHNTRFIDQVLVKGKKNPITIYEIYDHEIDEVKELKKINEIELTAAFEFYRVGNFSEAAEIYKSVMVKCQPHPSIPNMCADPLLLYYHQRCVYLNEQRSRGLLHEWTGIYEFMEK